MGERHSTQDKKISYYPVKLLYIFHIPQGRGIKKMCSFVPIEFNVLHFFFSRIALQHFNSSYFFIFQFCCISKQAPIPDFLYSYDAL